MQLSKWLILLSLTLVQGLLWAHGNPSAHPRWRTPVGNKDSAAIYLDSAAVSTDATRALGYYQQALAHAILQRQPDPQAQACLGIGEVQHRLGNLPEARSYLIRCIQLFQGTTPTYGSYGDYGSNSTQPRNNAGRRATKTEILRQASRCLTQVYEEEGNYGAALQTLLEMAIGTGLPPAGWRLDEGRLRSKLGQQQEAEQILLGAIAKAASDRKPQEECRGLLELGGHYQRTGATDKAKERYEEAQAKATQANLGAEKLAAGQALAILLNQQGAYSEEIELRNELASYSYGADKDVNSSYQNLAIGNALTEADQPEKAEKYVEKAVEKLQSLPVNSVGGKPWNSLPLPTATIGGMTPLEMSANAYRKLAEGFLQQADYEKSIAYYKKYAALQDSLMRLRDLELQEAMAMSKVLGQNEQRLQLLERESSLREQSIAVLQSDQAAKDSQIFSRNLIIGVLAACLLLGALAILLVVRNTRARRRADRLLTLQSLTGQMNPHFIFNALNSVNAYIAQNDERAANRYLSAFSKLMRRVMDDSRQRLITLAEEVEMLELYLSLEQARFGQQFSYQLEVAQDLDPTELLLPPMILQPYLENAVWHGLRYRPEGGHLWLRIRLEADALLVEIADDGIGIQQSQALKTSQQRKQNSLGMKNIALRMALLNELYAAEMTVTHGEHAPGSTYPGTRVHLRIPQAPLRKALLASPHPQGNNA